MPPFQFPDRLSPTRFFSFFKECTPRILVVTDGLSFSEGSNFGLTEFVETLRTSTIHGMTPVVHTATFSSGDPSFDADARHITNFRFAHPDLGLKISRYDVCFILGSSGEASIGLANEPNGLASLVEFMQQGGGVFATGDHEDLGAALSKDIPRVNKMRKWTGDVPDGSDETRLTTTLPGDNDAYEFEDQQDRHPQRLFVNYRTRAGGLNFAHPLLQIPCTTRAIEVFPDHAHEGECILPTDLSTKITPTNADEWPAAIDGGERPAPEMVALTMSAGRALPPNGKQPVTPRSFIAIAAYDGHRGNVGRVVTDATWHHFVNINVQPAKAPLSAQDLGDIKQYYRNLATWLMPKRTRRCLRYPLIIRELLDYPLFEELRPFPKPPVPLPEPISFARIGEQIRAALAHSQGQFVADELIADAMEDALGPDFDRKLSESSRRLGGISIQSARNVALAAFAHAAVAGLASDAVDDHQELLATLDQATGDLAAKAVRAYLKVAREDARRLLETLDHFGR